MQQQQQHPAQMKRHLDPAWVYRPACDTDLRETFERVRREQERQRLPDPFDANKEKPQ